MIEESQEQFYAKGCVLLASGEWERAISAIGLEFKCWIASYSLGFAASSEEFYQQLISHPQTEWNKYLAEKANLKPNNSFYVSSLDSERIRKVVAAVLADQHWRE